ncbi:MAG: hypothetical protein K9I29_03840 [Bacteroidales bacterium]|nr:hypothetical protein [Bacteroidales bacterium]MCF8327404.1 hypothetical protein [Bacteroidales bacterium]
MKRLLLVIMVLFVLLPLSNKAQVSGSNGNRFIMNAGITPDMFGFLVNSQYFFDLGKRKYHIGKRFEMNYIFQRNKSIGLLLDFGNAEGRYGMIRLPDYSEFSFKYKGAPSSYFPVKSRIVELSVRIYNERHIAPLANYVKFMGGILLASHEFDVDNFKDGLEYYDYDPSVYNPTNTADLDIPVQNLYASPYVGIGIGESFPISENLFLDLGANFRIFLTKNIFLRTINNKIDFFGLGSYGREDYERNNITKEDMLSYEVLGPAQINKTLNMNISLRYAF